MTILSVVQQAATRLGIDVPDLVFGSTDREMVEMQALVNEMAQRIAFNTQDWTRLKAIATLNGTGAQNSFSLPTDYKRMVKKASLWPSAMPNSPLHHYADADHWLALDVSNFQQLVGGWTIVGDAVLIKPAPANASTVQFYYLTRNIVKAADGSVKPEFMADDDSFRLDERLLKLGIIWQWKAQNGQPYAEDMATYEDALSYLVAADKGSNVLTVGQARWSGDVRAAYPGSLG